MIYYITNSETLRLFEHLTIRNATIKDCLDYISKLDFIGLDTETTGFDPYLCKLISIQLGDFNNQFVIDCNSINFIPYLKSILEDNKKIFLLQNAKFDLRFFLHLGIDIKNVYDTFLAECVLTTGLSDSKLGLKDIGLKYCNVELDKSIRGKIHSEGLSDRVIVYGAEDVKYLELIMLKQLKEIKRCSLTEVLNLENKVVRVFAKMEYFGVPFDPTSWSDVATVTEQNVKDLETALDLIIFNESKSNNNLSRYINYYKQGNLFFETVERKTNINWKSPAQKLKVLKALGLSLDSVDDKSLQKLKNRHEIIKSLIDYSKQSKLSTSFGKNFLKFIHKTTNRIHPNFWQILSTGRISVSEPNINQIPSHGELAKKIRASFKAPEGYKIVGGDFSGMELRVIAEISKDPVWVNAFKSNGDLHSILCSMTFNIPIEDVKKPFPPKPSFTYRDVQKTVNFGLAYGMSKFKLADTMQIDISEAEDIIERFFKSVPLVKKFLDSAGNFSKNKGYVRTLLPYGRVRWFDGWKSAYESGDFKKLGEIERAGKNAPIQGTNADITKLAMCMVQDEIDNNNYPVQIIMQVYDELQTLCKSEFAEEWKDILEKCMIDAAKHVLKEVPVIVDCKIADYWTK